MPRPACAPGADNAWSCHAGPTYNNRSLTGTRRRVGSRKETMSNIKISEHVLAQELSGETVLLDLKGEKYFGLDAVGTRVWQLLKQGQDRVALIDTLLAEYEVERETLEQDVAELLDNLSIAGLAEID